MSYAGVDANIADLTEIGRHMFSHGPPISRGRSVYALTDEMVLKVADPGGEEFNLREVARWEAVSGTAIEPAFAAVIDSDPDGAWLVMERWDTTLAEVYHRWVDTYPVWVAFRALYPGLPFMSDGGASSQLGTMLDARMAILEYASPADDGDTV